MGYLLRLRFAAFFAGAATASLSGMYFIHQDYMLAHESIDQQVKGLYKALDNRVSAIEKLKATEATSADAIE